MSSRGGRGRASKSAASGNLTPDERQERRQQQFRGRGRGRGTSRLTESKEQIRKEYEEFRKNERLNRILEAKKQENQFFLDDERRRDATEAYETIEKKYRELDKLIRERKEYEESNWLTVPGHRTKKYKDLLERNLIFQRFRRPTGYVQMVERKRNTLELTNKIQKRASEHVLDVLDSNQIEAVKNTPEYLPGMKTLLKGIIYENLRQWLTYEFEFIDECPFCNLKYLSGNLAREHIDQKHLVHFAEKAVEKYFQV